MKTRSYNPPFAHRLEIERFDGSVAVILYKQGEHPKDKLKHAEGLTPSTKIRAAWTDGVPYYGDCLT